MIDLIIPVYKNKPGLYKTLMSIGTEVFDKIKVTIVDDNSQEDYSDIICLFEKIFPLRILKLNTNKGPGVARQYGLDNSKEPYVSFIDCGDVFFTPSTLKEMIAELENNPEINLFSWQHLEEDKEGHSTITPAINNRIHGKIYKRDFLKKHNISFSSKSSYANEDIGFNIACRLINEELFRQDNKSRVIHYEHPAVIWKWDDNSLVRKNNCAYYFKDQNLGLAINSEHAIQIAIENGVREELIEKELCESLATMYIFYLSALGAKKEYVENTLTGALYYYKNVFLKYSKIDAYQMKECYYNVLSSFISNPQDPIRYTLLAFDYAGFLNYLQELLEKEQSIEEG